MLSVVQETILERDSPPLASNFPLSKRLPRDFYVFGLRCQLDSSLREGPLLVDMFMDLIFIGPRFALSICFHVKVAKSHT